MKYSHIVFDVDGTLIDTFYSNMQSLQDTLRDLTGEVYPLEELGRFFGIPGMETAVQLGLDDPAGALAQWVENLQRYRHTDRVYDGIPELLETLSRAGLALGVVTSRTRAEFDADFSTLPIARYFQTTITASDTVRHKPEPDPLLEYIRQTGCEKGQVLFIGDSPYDMQCAAAAGVASGLAGWGATGPRPCTHYFETPEEVSTLVLS